jgi:hypothetical protein
MNKIFSKMKNQVSVGHLCITTRYYIRRPCFKIGEVPPRYEKIDAHPFSDLINSAWPDVTAPSRSYFIKFG